jgi:hypothetical protein
MEPDDLLCLRNARPQKDEEGAARRPSCSQNAHDETVLVRCAQWKINQPPSLKRQRASDVQINETPACPQNIYAVC